jgi:hypothetical protein
MMVHTEIDTLMVELRKIKSESKQMEMVHCGIKGLAFFPGGRGLFKMDDETISNKEIMILGQDFDTLEKYQIAVQNGEEDVLKNKTWRNLSSILELSNIPLTNCFFTNCLMGVRIAESAIGVSPGYKDTSFVKSCQDLFLFQLDLQKPKVIFALGIQVAKFLSQLSKNLEGWKSINSFVNLDSSGESPVKKNIQFEFDGKIICTDLVLLMHPSARKFNLVKRTYKGLQGMDAQIQMIRDVYQTSD